MKKTQKRINPAVVVVLALVLAFAVSCQHATPRLHQPGPPHTAPEFPVEIRKAKTTPEGRVVLYEWSVAGETRSAELGGDYGLMVFYDAWAAQPSPRFALYLNDSGEVVETTSLEQFKTELRRIPAGDTLHYYNTCQGGTHHGLDPAVLEELRRHCRKNGVTFQRGDDVLFSICKCR